MPPPSLPAGGRAAAPLGASSDGFVDIAARHARIGFADRIDERCSRREIA
jgi:hypothetical protein